MNKLLIFLTDARLTSHSSDLIKNCNDKFRLLLERVSQVDLLNLLIEIPHDFLRRFITIILHLHLLNIAFVCYLLSQVSRCSSMTNNSNIFSTISVNSFSIIGKFIYYMIAMPMIVCIRNPIWKTCVIQSISTRCLRKYID